jgi:hypothetical protein
LTLGGTLSASVIDNMTDEHRLFNNMGDIHSTRTSFDATNPSYNFGWRFVQGSTNGPGVNGATQYYSEYVGLGNDYAATGAGSYGMQIAYPRNVTVPYITIRYNEGNALGTWQKISAGYADSAGNAGTVTNGVYTTGNQTIGGTKTFSTSLRVPTVGTTWIGGFRGDSGITSSTVGTVSSYHGWYSARTPSGGFTIGTLSDTFYCNWATNTNIDNNTNSISTPLYINSAGTAGAAGDFRAPIFYDSNNTGFYVDPNAATSAMLAGTVTLATVPNYRNTTTIASNYTITSSYNEMSIGPITINNGVTVTIDNNANWVIV